ncbi:MAG: PDZ domain-containing protein [Acidimicrobiales bacterium]
MTVTPGDFGESFDEDPHPPLLPPEDRLWRHPSELGASDSTLPLDPVAVRRRWLLSHPSRRSVLTAGLVGALLATGVVALGTHLADSMEGTSLSQMQGAGEAGQTARVATDAGSGLSPSVISSISRASAAMAFVDASRGTTRVRVLGLVVRPDGMILVPASSVTGATTLIVTLANGDVYAGDLVGVDQRSDLAVVHINGASGLATVALAADPMSQGSLTLAVTTPGSTAFSLGMVRDLDSSPVVGGHRLLAALTTDLSPASGPPGSPLLGSTGLVEGIITGSTRSGVVATPSWLAAPVAVELMAAGTVTHGWLGLKGVTATGDPSGVRVTSIAAHSALAKAGVKPGDVITSLDRQPLTSLGELQARLYVLPPGTRVSLGIVHDAVCSVRSAVLGATPSS